MVVDRLLRSWTDAKKSFLTQKYLTHLIAAYSCKGFTTKVSVYHHQHGKCDLPLAPSISCHLRALRPFPHNLATPQARKFLRSVPAGFFSQTLSLPSSSIAQCRTCINQNPPEISVFGMCFRVSIHTERSRTRNIGQTGVIRVITNN